MLKFLLFLLVLTPQLLTRTTGEVDAWQLATVADSLRIPRVVMWGVAWEESRSGYKWNNYLGPGVVKYEKRDSVVVSRRVCREVGRMQLSPCVDWTFLNPLCTYKNIHIYKYNIWCGALNLRHKFEIFGSWPEAIRRYNGDGDGASEYQERVLKTIGRLSITVPSGTLKSPHRRPSGQE